MALACLYSECVYWWRASRDVCVESLWRAGNGSRSPSLFWMASRMLSESQSMQGVVVQIWMWYFPTGWTEEHGVESRYFINPHWSNAQDLCHLQEKSGNAFRTIALNQKMKTEYVNNRKWEVHCDIEKNKYEILLLILFLLFSNIYYTVYFCAPAEQWPTFCRNLYLNKTEQYLWMKLDCKMLNIYSRFDSLQYGNGNACLINVMCFMKAGWLNKNTAVHQ